MRSGRLKPPLITSERLTDSVLRASRQSARKPGERTDLARAKEIIQKHRTWTDVINDNSVCAVISKHWKWAHDIFENRPARPVDEATTLASFAKWQCDVLELIGCGSTAVAATNQVLWFHSEDPQKLLHLHHLASFCQSNRGAYTFSAASESEGIAHRYQSQSLVVCLAVGNSPKFNILASMIAGVLPTGKFEGRQQLRAERAVVAVFADHAPCEKLSGIATVHEIPDDENATEPDRDYDYDDAEDD